MELQGWTTISVVLLMVGLLAFTAIGADLIMLGGLTLLLTFGVLTPTEALEGFANQATITVAALFVVAAGLRESGAVSFLAQRVLGRPTSVLGAQARLLLPTISIGAFICNTPFVALMLPVVDDWAKKSRIAASQLMIPLSYGKILVGQCTLLGTSTNLLVNGLIVSQAQLPALRLFDITWVGLPCAAAGLAYILIFTRWLLPDRQRIISDRDDPRQYTVEMTVESGSSLVGQTIEGAGLRHLPGLYLVEIDRDGQSLPAVGPKERLRGEDRLVFAGILDSVVDLQKIRGLKPATDQVVKLNGSPSHRCLIEAVVSNTCPLSGQTIREGRFRTVYNAAVIAVARNGARLRKKIGDIVLQAGDTLLLQSHPSFVDQQRNSSDFFLVSRVENSTLPRHDRAWIALAILLGMVVVAGFGWLSMLNAALLAAGLVILTRCCSGPLARRSLDWRVLLVIAASIGIGRAMEVSGAAAVISQRLIGLAGDKPWITLAVVYVITMVFTEVMSHYGAVVLIFPIALAAARTLGVSFMPFVMAIMIASSCGFATPIGYPTNIMVYGPGGYRFWDYVRFGGPLNLLVGAIAVALAPVVWPF